ncbi:MAG: cytochrome c [Alphaproteobacteria bacterium]|nr:cytochrome c [Alphaproteobacteria bacterium]
MPIALALLLLAGSAAAQDIQTASRVEEGLVIATRWCAACHTVGPQGSGADIAPTFDNIAARRNSDDLRRFLAAPHAPMPRLDLSFGEIDALVAYIESFDRGG